jgi:hypothetical protein
MFRGGDSKIPEPCVFFVGGGSKCLAISLFCGSVSHALKLFKPDTLSWSFNVVTFFAIALFFLVADMVKRRERGDLTNSMVPIVCCSIALGAIGYLYALFLSAVEGRILSIQYLLPLISGALGALFGFCFAQTITRVLFPR